jgi:hypothetical protein
MVERVKENWPMVPIGVALGLLALALFLQPSQFTNLAWYALVALTAVYAYATIRVMRSTSKQTAETKRMIEEMRQSRLDAVRPALSLQPGGFTFGGGFSFLYLMNSGGVAKNVKIDIELTNPDEKKAIFVPAINKEHMVLLTLENVGKIQDLGGFLKVNVSFEDSYNQSLNESLSIDFSELKKEERELRGQYSGLDDIREALEKIENDMRWRKSA